MDQKRGARSGHDLKGNSKPHAFVTRRWMLTVLSGAVCWSEDQDSRRR